MHEEVQGMTGSRLGRGRSGRIAMYVGCGVVMLLLVYLYRTTTWEMAKLHDLHEQCVHQQEALAAQLQVIFEYKVRLEKSLAEEKSSNAMVKQELQQRASREKSLRDKDSVEAMQRFNSLQQTYKLLQTEHQDLQEECKKHEKQALDETNRLQVTLQELRSRVRKMYDDKNALENFKTKFLELDSEKTELEEKYREVLMSALNSDSVIEHLRKEIIQLKKEMENRKSQKSFTPIPTSSSTLASQQTLKKGDSQPIPAPQQQQPQQQVSSPWLLSSYNSRAAGEVNVEKRLNDDELVNNDIRFVQRNGNIVPADPNELKETTSRQPSGNDFQQKQQGDVVERPNMEKTVLEKQNVHSNKEEHKKQVISSPDLNRNNISKHEIPVLAAPVSQTEQPLKRSSTEKASKLIRKPENDELQALQERVDGILDRDTLH